MTKKKTIKVVVAMIIICTLVIGFYYYQSNRTDSPNKDKAGHMDEINTLLEKDLELNYPSTSKEVLNLYNRMVKELYSNIEDEQVKQLGLKMRDLYDDELLEKNSVDDYLFELVNDVAIYRKSKRIIRSYDVDEEDKVTTKSKDGREYSVLNTTYKINEKSEFYTVVHQFILRKDGEGKWKILGWKVTDTINGASD